jgi:AraC-like DNA-binding protein
MALTRDLEKEEEPKDKSGLVSAEDENLIRKAQAFIEANIADTNLSVKKVAESLGLSERQLYRKVAPVMGMTPNEFITEVKLQYARKLLLAGKVIKLSQLTHELGYSNDSYFSNLFYQRFGKRPSALIH